MPERPQLITGNWKMNFLRATARDLAVAVVNALRVHGAPAGRRIAVAPPYTALGEVRDVLAGSGVMLAAQDVAATAEGPYTGEVSAAMLADADVDLVIVGHSERRQLLGETDDTVGQKVDRAVAQGLEVTVCVGETAEERDAGQAEAVVTRQIGAVFTGRGELSSLISVVYEPIWAIGTGRTAAAADAQRMHAHIRATARATAGDAAAVALVIQYGGSVKPGNAGALMDAPDVDGLLVGGASLDARSFELICRVS